MNDQRRTALLIAEKAQASQHTADAIADLARDLLAHVMNRPSTVENVERSLLSIIAKAEGIATNGAHIRADLALHVKADEHTESRLTANLNALRAEVEAEEAERGIALHHATESCDRPCDAMLDLAGCAWCDEHGAQEVVEEKTSPGYCGPIYQSILACGCSQVDASHDVPEP